MKQIKKIFKKSNGKNIGLDTKKYANALASLKMAYEQLCNDAFYPKKINEEASLNILKKLGLIDGEKGKSAFGFKLDVVKSFFANYDELKKKIM